MWMAVFFFSSRRRHTRFDCDWSSDVCSSDLRGRRNDREAPRTLPESPLPLGPRGHVGRRGDRRPPARPLPEALGGAGATWRRRARRQDPSRVARTLPAPPGSLHGRDGHVDDVALGDRRVLHARRPAVALRAPGGGGRADRLEERRAALPGALAAQALDEATVPVAAEAAERLVGFEPRDLVHLLVVVADLLERPHEEPADRLLDPPPV